MHNNKIYYSNELARANSLFTLEEEKLLHIVLGKLNPHIKNPLVFSFPKKEIFEKLNLTAKDRYDRYAEIFEGLAKKTYAQLKDINGKVCAAALIDCSEWGKKAQDVKVHLNPKFMHHLERLTSQFTSVQAKSILSLNTKNAVTIYKYLISWMDKKVAVNEIYVGTCRLKEMFDLRDAAYVYKGRFHNVCFEKYTLKKYIKDINENTELNVRYTKNKSQNKIKNYKLYVESKSQDQLNEKTFIKDLKEIKEKIKIRSVVGNYLNLVKKGQNYSTICPFHKDTKPSLSVSEEKNVFKCFSCGCSGNAIDFIMKYEHVSFSDAVVKAGELMNIKVVVNRGGNLKKHNVLYQINKITCDSYFLHLNHSEKAKEWLIKERNLTEELISFFRIGFTDEPDHNLQELYLRWNITHTKEKISFFEIEKLGILRSKQKEQYINFFQNRIMFPIFDTNNNVVGFLGRAIDEKQKIKYLNSKESEIFKKSENLYNIQNLQKNKPIYIFEGVFDLISAHKIGFTNSVAIMGSDLNDSHLKMLCKYSEKIIFCFDNDCAGHKNTIKSYNKAVRLKIKPYIVFIDKYKDIDLFINKDENAAKKVLENPISFNDWKNLLPVSTQNKNKKIAVSVELYNIYN